MFALAGNSTTMLSLDACHASHEQRVDEYE